MATTQKNSPKSQGFQGVRDAIWIIVICGVIAFLFYEYFLGNPSNFHGGDNSGEPANLLGTIYKGGIVVPVIFTLLFTVISLGVERYLALRSAFGKISEYVFYNRCRWFYDYYDKCVFKRHFSSK